MKQTVYLAVAIPSHTFQTGHDSELQWAGLERPCMLFLFRDGQEGRAFPDTLTARAMPLLLFTVSLAGKGGTFLDTAFEDRRGGAMQLPFKGGAYLKFVFPTTHTLCKETSLRRTEQTEASHQTWPPLLQKLHNQG